MAWDKFAGRTRTTVTTTATYETKVFDIDAGGFVVRTKSDGSMPDLEDHLEIGAVKAVVIAHRTTVTPSSNIVYLDDSISQEEEYAFKRIFCGFAAVENPPQYGGRVTITFGTGTSGAITVTVSRNTTQLASLSLASVQGSNAITYGALGYTETSSAMNSSGSSWSDGSWAWSGSTYSTSGTFRWDAPAARPDPE